MSRKEECFQKDLGQFFEEAFEADEINLNFSDERYQNLAIFSEGGVKEIYTCLDSHTGRSVAMAKLKPEQLDKRRESFIREARINAALQHPNIIPVYDLGMEGDSPWFTMKFIRGVNLNDIIKNLKNGKESRFHNLNDRLDIFLKVCDAIAYAHSIGILHLDLKPENIRINNYGDVSVCDWGLADVIPAECDEPLIEFSGLIDQDLKDVTLHGVVKGTPGYLAPEQTSLVKMRKGKHTDIFSLGALLYTLLSFEVPFKGRDLRDILEKTAKGDFSKPSTLVDHMIPISLEAVCLKAMSHKPEDRYLSVRELQDEIRGFINGFVTDAENASLGKLMKTWVNRNPALTLLSSALFILAFFLMTSFVLNLKLEEKSAKAEADKLRIENEYNLRMNKEAAPRFLDRAQSSYGAFEFDDALNFCNSAVDLDDTLQGAWELKGNLHFIRQEFSEALQAFSKVEAKNKNLMKVCQEYRLIKANDQQTLSIDSYLALLKDILALGLGRQFSNLIHYKVYGEMDIDDRIKFCKGVLLIHNGTLTDLKFDYNKETQYLDLSHNDELEVALCLQNFPALSMDLSHTKIKDFISFRGQSVKTINASNTAVVELHSLNNPNLEHLNISQTSITNLSPLLRHPNIKSIDLSFNQISNLSILSTLPNLERIIIHKGFPESQIKLIPAEIIIEFVD